MRETAEAELRRRGAVAPGDVIAIVAGTRMASGSTNLMRLHRVSGETGQQRPERRRVARFKPLPQPRNR
jgi:hypothetical protein